MDTFNLFDLIITGCGIYVVYTTIKTKVTGEVASGLMIGKNVDIKKAKDIKGFISYMYGKTLFIGILTVICGLLGLLNTYMLDNLVLLELIVCCVYFVLLIIYCIISVKAQKKYLTGETK